MVLVDASHPEQFTRSAEGRKYYEPTRRVVAIAPWLARLGVFRLFDLDPAPQGLPPEPRAQVEALGSSTQQSATAAEEFRAIPDTSAQVRGTGGLGDRPLFSSAPAKGRPAPLVLLLARTARRAGRPLLRQPPPRCGGGDARIALVREARRPGNQRGHPQGSGRRAQRSTACAVEPWHSIQE